ncbi:bifunctional adenosylcobinamide kinase/adenosylcobinamide-phosphate guanylyltransferase [Candidatus Merdisoma sp. HCP28S3_D10]|uniref:bifunctional adenosylcobinamide kinase/adenosylcobinamide-phosphate guanylyltransferase n=1 Tax=unclassified Candidatus Merdisoma TaxID=3099611 RepID=UPI003F88FB24
MILITGGAFQGKKAYAKKRFALKEQDMVNGADCTEAELLKARAVVDFQEYVRRVLKEGGDPSLLAEKLYTENPDILVITNELGSGVIPANPFERQWREASGRAACDLAKYAAEVHRVVCGIGTVIKE